MRAGGRPHEDDRRVLDGIVWKVRTGVAWREVPSRYGSRQSLYTRANTAPGEAFQEHHPGWREGIAAIGATSRASGVVVRWILCFWLCEAGRGILWPVFVECFNLVSPLWPPQGASERSGNRAEMREWRT
ncbi:transposase [Spongiactinospora sp. 9N601]|uniref:transposase n=1 Tax=Spongiactinospora sp. 9N601 TaxID=3375149 RepID=UPI0037A28FB1